MAVSRRSFSLALAMTPGIGGRTVARVLARNDLLGRTIEEFFEFSFETLIEEYRIPRKVAQVLVDHRLELIEKVEPLQRRLETLGVRWAVITDAVYPEMLEQFDSNPPAMLFYYGNSQLLSSQRFCVLSSRGASPNQLVDIEQITEREVLNGKVLVSGHDRPEYQRSAIVPLRWGAPRILCLDRGLFQVLGEDLKSEAFRAARLWRYEFDPKTDLVISPFRPEAGFIGLNNQVRDRLIAGLSQELHFVNVRPQGTMEKILKSAQKTGRIVHSV